MGAPAGALLACGGLQCSTAVLLLSTVLLIAAAAPSAHAHPRTLLQGEHIPTGSNSSGSGGPDMQAPSKPLATLSSKLPTMHQPPADVANTNARHISKQPEGDRQEHSGFGNGQPALKKLPRALDLEHPFLGLDPHGPFPDAPLPAADQQSLKQQKLTGNADTDLSKPPVPMALAHGVPAPLQVPAINAENTMQHGKHHDHLEPGNAASSSKLPPPGLGLKPGNRMQPDVHCNDHEDHQDPPEGHAHKKLVPAAKDSSAASMPVPKASDVPTPGVPQPTFKLRDVEEHQAGRLQPDLSGPGRDNHSTAVDQLSMGLAKRKLQQDGPYKQDWKDSLSKFDSSSASSPPQTDISSDMNHELHQKSVKADSSTMLGPTGNPSMLPRRQSAVDQEHEQHQQHNGFQNGQQQPPCMQPGKADHALIAPGNPAMQSPGLTVAQEEEHQVQHHTAADAHYDHGGLSKDKLMHMQHIKGDLADQAPPLAGNPSMMPQPDFSDAGHEYVQHQHARGTGEPAHSKTSTGGVPPMGNPSIPPQQVPPPPCKPNALSRRVFTSSKGDGMHIPMRNLDPPHAAPEAGPQAGHGYEWQPDQPHHVRSLQAAVDALSGTGPQELLQADSQLPADSADSVPAADSHSELEAHLHKTTPVSHTTSTNPLTQAAASMPSAAVKTQQAQHAAGDPGGRVSYVTSASGLPAIKIDFRSKAARKKQPNPETGADAEAAVRGGSPNANLLEGFQPLPLVDPGMLAAMLSGPPGMAGQWGGGFGR